MTLQEAWTKRLRLRAESDRLWDEATNLWAEAVIEAHGNVRLEWKSRDGAIDCHLETGEVFRGDESVDAPSSPN